MVISADSVYRTRQRLVEEGLESALTYNYSSRSARPRIFDSAAEAKLIALACGAPPKGRARWTLELLEEQVVALKIVERASDNTIGRTLKSLLRHHQQKQRVIAPDANAAFVAADLRGRGRGRGRRRGFRRLVDRKRMNGG